MARMKVFAIAAAFAAGTTLAGPADAAFIDFTDDIWTTSQSGDTSSRKTRTIGGFGEVTVEAFADGGGSGTLTFMGSVPGNPTPPCDFLACDNDGAGVNDDEVTFGVGMKQDVERLKVTIENPISLGKLHFLDLFAAGGSSGDTEVETAQFQINGDGGPGGTLDGTALDNVGYGVTGDLGLDNVSMIEFFADDFRAASSTNTDFAVAAIQSVPAPATVGLLGIGLIALGASARRRHAA